MKNKYRELIEYILSGVERSRILNETSDSIVLGILNMGGTTLFIITQTFGKVTVQWKVDSPVFGKHKTLNIKESGCIDLSKSAELGNLDAFEDIKKQCN